VNLLRLLRLFDPVHNYCVVEAVVMDFVDGFREAWAIRSAPAPEAPTALVECPCGETWVQVYRGGKATHSSCSACRGTCVPSHERNLAEVG